MIFDDKFNYEGLNRLKYMLVMADKVKNSNMSEHDASVAVGQRLVDEFVIPTLRENKKIIK